MTCSILNLTKVCTEEKNIRGSLKFKYLKLGVFKQFSPVVMNTGQSWLRVRYCGERSWGRRVVLVSITAFLNGVSGRDKALIPYGIQNGTDYVSFRRMENSFKSYIVFCASDEPKEHVGVSVCDVGLVRLRSELCKHLCNYFFLCSFSIQLHKLFYTEHIQVISPQLYQEVQ